MVMKYLIIRLPYYLLPEETEKLNYRNTVPQQIELSEEEFKGLINNLEYLFDNLDYTEEYEISCFNKLKGLIDGD